MIRFDKRAISVAIFALISLLQVTLWAQQSNAPSQNASMDDRIHNFWNWFSKNQVLFSDLEKEKENGVPEIVEHLKQISQNLVIEIEVPKNGVRVMAISADGVEANFPLVQQLVAAAPSIPGWKIVAFRQPGKLEGMVLKYPGITLDTSKMWIMPIEADDGFDLIVFFPDYTSDKRNRFINGTYVLLDNAIGEFNVVKGIRTLDFQQLPPVGDRKGILPFVELPNVFAAYQAKHHK